jgi:hypothetical protein
MRIRRVFTSLLTILIIIFNFACGSGRDGSDTGSNAQNPLESTGLILTTNIENPLIGTWVSGRYSLTFKSDYTYSIDINRDGIAEFKGSVTISGNVVIFTDAGGNSSYSWEDNGQAISGSYTYAISGNTLTFSPVLDLCRDRVNILCLSYQKK